MASLTDSAVQSCRATPITVCLRSSTAQADRISATNPRSALVQVRVLGWLARKEADLVLAWRSSGRSSFLLLAKAGPKNFPELPRIGWRRACNRGCCPPSAKVGSPPPAAAAHASPRRTSRQATSVQPVAGSQAWRQPPFPQQQ